MNIIRHKVILVGCGDHYMKIYHSVLEKSGISISLLIDLEARKKEIEHFFSDKILQPEKSLFLEESFRNFITLNQIEELIKQAINIEEVDSMILCVEPKVKKPYIIWAAERGLAIFMDKPINAFFNPAYMDTLLDDYNEIAKVINKTKANVVISCERRAHVGYQWVNEYLCQFMNDLHIPITSIDIHFAGGNYLLPHEYLKRENHPFKYGYGILMHSGYHYVDLLATFLSLNHSIIFKESLNYVLKLLYFNPTNQQLAIGEHSYSILESYNHSHPPSRSYKEKMKNFGETDIMLIGQGNKDNEAVTNFSVKMVGTSVSNRKQSKSRPATGHIEGRIRQEHVILHLGFLCSIHIASNPLKKLDPRRYLIEDFNITIMNSPVLKDRQPVITIDRKKISELFPHVAETASMNNYARQWQLNEFLKGRNANSAFSSHYNTVQLLNHIYSIIKTNYENKCIISNV